MKIDGIRETIQKWFDEEVITENEFYILLTSLIESVPFVSNISGTYGAFLKYWDPRALKPFKLIVPLIITSDIEHEIYNEDSNILIENINCDILYLDPPYNTRQYATNYHILETIAAWDNPKIYGKTGLRPYKHQKSSYCDKSKCIQALEDLIASANAKHILLSYNNEGLIPEKEILRIMGKRGKVKIYEKPYRRFRSDSDEKRNYKCDDVTEKIYYVKIKN